MLSLIQFYDNRKLPKLVKKLQKVALLLTCLSCIAEKFASFVLGQGTKGNCLATFEWLN